MRARKDTSQFSLHSIPQKRPIAFLVPLRVTMSAEEIDPDVLDENVWTRIRPLPLDERVYIIKESVSERCSGFNPGGCVNGRAAIRNDIRMDGLFF